MQTQTQPKLKNQEVEGVDLKSAFGTFLMALSGAIMYIDKVIEFFGYSSDYEFKYYVDLETYLWTITQTIAPLLIIFSLFFNPKKWSYAAPVAVFSIQLMHIFKDEYWIHKDYFWAYTVAFVLAFAFMIVFIKRIINWISLAAQSYRFKSLVRFLSRKVFKDIIPYVKDKEEYTKKIIQPTVDRLSE